MGCTCSTDLTINNNNRTSQVKYTGILVTCEICCEEQDSALAVVCSKKGGHTLCSACFQNQVSAWSDPATGGSGSDAVRLLKEVPQNRKTLNAKELGAIPCFMNCGAKIPAKVVRAKVQDDDTRRDFDLACIRIEEKFAMGRNNTSKEGSIILSQKRVAAELGLKRDRSEREIFVEENLLTLACPKCHLAVYDFDGCFAVRCSGCQEYFCAWCMKFHGDSSQCHTHVRECEENLKHKGRYGHENGIGLAAFNQHHEDRRVRLCTQFLRAEHDKDLAKRVKPVLKASLGDNATSNILRQLSFI